MVNTDISIAIPQDCYARIAPRSGLAWKHSIDTGAGVIDCDYRGPVKVILFNFSDVDFQVRATGRTEYTISIRAMCVLGDVRALPSLTNAARASDRAWLSQINRGDRIAQLILERIFTPEVVETDNLDVTVRGAGGLGSTGGFGTA